MTRTDQDRRDLAYEVLTVMEQDCGPESAEPYASWAKTLAADVVSLLERDGGSAT